MKKILISASILAVLDQFTKHYAIQNLPYSENTGIAFGIPIPNLVMIVATLIFIPLILHVAKKELKLKLPSAQLSIALIIGGALGNLVDRLARGAVTDFINLGWWPSFNLADAYIVIGTLSLIITYDKLKKA